MSTPKQPAKRVNGQDARYSVTAPAPYADRLLTRREILGDPKASPPLEPIVPVGRTQFRRMVRSGQFPAPEPEGARPDLWRGMKVWLWVIGDDSWKVTT